MRIHVIFSTFHFAEVNSPDSWWFHYIPDKKLHSTETVLIKVVNTVTLCLTWMSHFYKLRSLKIIRDPWDQKWNKLLMEDWVADTVCHHPWSIHNKIERPQARMYPIFLVVFWKCSKEAEFWYMKFCLLKKHCAFFCAGWHFIFAKWSMQNTSPQNCSSHQSCWGCGLSWIHLISSGANSTCVSGSNLGNPILRYKISKFYNTAKRKKSKGHKCYTFKYLWECQSTTWKSNDSTRSWTNTTALAH